MLGLVFWVAVGFFADASECGEAFLDTSVTHATGVQGTVEVAAYPAVAVRLCFFGLVVVIVIAVVCCFVLLLSFGIGFAFLVFTFALRL